MPPRDDLNTTDAAASGFLTTELATRSRSVDFFALGNLYLPNPDPILRAEG
jgi:hypothetical protein